MWKLDCVYWDYDDKLVMPIYSDMPTIRNHKGNKKTNKINKANKKLAKQN